MTRWRSIRLCLSAALALLSALGTVAAQEFEPRTYAVAPVGLSFFALGSGGNRGTGSDFDSIAVSWQVAW